MRKIARKIYCRHSTISGMTKFRCKNSDIEIKSGSDWKRATKIAEGRYLKQL